MLRRSYGPTRGDSPVRRRRLSIVLAVGLAAGATFSGMGPASAAPSGDIGSLTAQAQRIEAQIQANNTRADILDEQYLQAQSAVDDATQKIADAEQGIARAETRAAKLRSRLGARAARLYMGAGNVDLFAIDAATNVQDLGSRSKYGEAAAETDRRILDDLKLTEEQLGIQRKDLGQQRTAAEKRKREADSARTAIENATRQQEQLLASVKGSIKAKVDELAQQRRAAQEAAARAEFARRQAAARAADASPVTTGRGVTSVDIGSSPGNIPAPNPAAQKAIDYAKAQLGKPYQYAGTGPDSFDCSGLTMMAWAQAGVSMTHNAEAQYGEFPHVPVDQLAPGDLVFFGSPIHHVGLYVGGGTMIEAPQTGEFVHYSSVGRSDYVGAARP